MTQRVTFADRAERRMREADSLVCVGLDPALDRLPDAYPRTIESLVRFCQAIVEATAPYVAAFKPNLGFFTALGRPGPEALWAVRQAIPDDVPVILDCKVGDVSETARAYAHGWFGEFAFDAVTVSPYLGEDAIAPFLKYEEKGIFILCKTSNPGSGDLQDLVVENGEPLYLNVAGRCSGWEAAYPASVGLVVGATYPEQLQLVRQRVGDQIILVPGFGAQGGAMEASVTAGLNERGTGLLCSSSRAIMHASSGPDFAEAAASAAQRMRDDLNGVRSALASGRRDTLESA